MNESPRRLGPGSLSVCMIVKNEEEMLADCLQSIHQVADQIIVMDTGSSDKTVAIAEEYGAEIQYFTWCDSFAAARNASIQGARGDWIFWLDADERLQESSAPLLKKILQKPVEGPTVYKVNIRSITDNGRNFHDSDAHRLFTNHYGIRFEGVIHEQVAQSASQLHAKEVASGLMLDHLGYDLDGEGQEKKLERNRPLLEKMVKDRPKDAFAHFWLAQNLSQGGDTAQAIRQMTKALSLKQFNRSFQASALNILAQLYSRNDQWGKAVSAARKSTTIIPMQFGGYYIQYLAADRMADGRTAIDLLQKMIRNTQHLLTSVKEVSSDSLAPIQDLHTALAAQYRKTNQKDLALEEFQKARQEAGGDAYLKHIVNLCQELGRADILYETLLDSISKGNDSAEVLDLLGVTQIKLQRFDEALATYETLYSQLPENEGVARRIASLHAKLGNLEKAHKILMTAGSAP